MIKPRVVVVLLLLLTTSSLGAQPQATAKKTAGGDVGRYQIVEVKVSSLTSQGGIIDQPRVFRIDTVTGATWLYFEDFDKQRGGVVAGWQAVREMTDLAPFALPQRSH